MLAAIASGSSSVPQLMSSPDGITWTAQSSPTDSQGGLCIAFGDGVFVALALASDGITTVSLTSPDAVTWTSHPVPQPQSQYIALIFANGLFVALDNVQQPVIMVSPDGVTWTQTATLDFNDSDWQDLAYGAGLYVAVGRSSGIETFPLGAVVSTSPDGIAWTTRNPPLAPLAIYWFLNGICFGDGQFVVVNGSATPGTGYNVLTSPDGITWTLQTSPSRPEWRSVAYGAGLYVAVSDDNLGETMTSPDGVTWTLRSVPAAQNCAKIVFLDGQFLVACDGTGGSTILTSPDGLAWTAQPSAIAELPSNVEDVAFGIPSVGPSITCGSPPAGTVGVPYSHFFPTSGGTPPYTFTIIAGSLPTGLSLDAATGEAAGTPTLAGIFPFTIQVADSTLATASVACSITIAPPVLSIVCGSPPSGTVGVAYSHFFPASGGTPPYIFAIIAGSLPTGLSLNVATGEVAGPPTTAGPFPFTVQVTDSTSVSASVACSITIAPAPPPSPPFPFGNLPAGSTKQAGGGCVRARTAWDACIDAEARRYRHIVFPRSCTIPEQYKNLLPWDEDFGAIPEQSKPLRQTAGILTPAPAAGDQVMLSYRIGKGFFALLSGFFFQYSGVGFTQGSGDILFRIKLNQRYVKDLSDVPFTLGSPKFPIPMTQGQIALSDQVVEMIVNVPNLSGLIQVGFSTCYAGLYGFLWPYG